MNRQFIALNSSQGQELEQVSPSEGWLTADIDASASSGLPQEGSSPQVTRRPPGTGLLSKFKSNQLQLQQSRQVNAVVNVAPASLLEQDTLQQPAIQGPITASLSTHTGVAQPIPLGQLSPHESGITSSPAFFSNAQTLSPFGSRPSAPLVDTGLTPSQPPLVSQPLSPLPGANPPLQPFVSQPLSPPTWSNPSQPLQPFAPVPGQSQVAWQGNGYQGWNGSPPFAQSPPGQSSGNKSRKNKKKRRFPIWARVILTIITILLILVGSGIYYYEANFATVVSNTTGQTVNRIKGDDDTSQGRSSTGTGENILSGKRINILLLGSDTDEKFQGGYLAQTDIVVTIDPTTKTVGMLSIPRDTWLAAADGKGMMKLDQAYFYGGPALTMATIHQDFGIYIDHYAWVGLDGFINVIQTAGGVDIDVTHPITDDVYPDDTGNSKNAYAYKRLYIAPGPQHLDGPTALEYVRSRHADLVGDFGRSARQQQVLDQLKTKLDNPDIVAKLPELAKDLNGYVKTDMQLTDVFKLMDFAHTIDQNKINRVILDTKYSRTTNLQTPNEGLQSVVILNCDAVRPVIAKMFSLGNNALCNTGISSNGTPAMVSQPSHTSASFSQASTSNTWRMASISTMSLGGGSKHWFGIRSLIELMLLVVFESPAALQV